MPAETTETRDTPDSPKVDPNLKKKQILVAVLLVGLLIAIVTQPAKDAAEGDQQLVEANLVSADAESLAQQPTTMTTPAAGPTSAPDGRFNQTCQLSQLEIDDIVQLELLAAPPRPRYKDRSDAVQHVQAIYGTNAQRTALLGESIIRDGQSLPDGGKVVRVHSDGVRVEQ